MAPPSPLSYRVPLPVPSPFPTRGVPGGWKDPWDDDPVAAVHAALQLSRRRTTPDPPPVEARGHDLEQAGTAMKTIRQLREERGESQRQLAEAVGVRRELVEEWEQGRARPSVLSLRELSEHFGVAEEDIDLEPNRPPSLGEQLGDALDG